MKTHGTFEYPLTEQIRDAIAVHGLAWTLREYVRILTTFELRIFFRTAYVGGVK